MQDHHARDAAQPAEGFLMQLRPDLRTETEHQQPHRFAAIAQGQDKQPRPPILTRAGVTYQRACAVTNLRLLRARSRSPRTLPLTASPATGGRTFDTLITAAEAMDIHQILPDRLGATAP